MIHTRKTGGFLLIDKPSGITSFSVIRHVQRLLGKGIRIGHAGTLDPLASGLLLVAIGRESTRQLKVTCSYTKTYRCTGKLFELTDTYDRFGTITHTETPFFVDHDALIGALSSFKNGYVQAPPVYSAVKHHGVPLYKLARKNRLPLEELTRITTFKKKDVTVSESKLLSYDMPFFSFEVTVSHGAYVRILVNDIARSLGTVATVQELMRTHIGPLSSEHAVTLESLTSSDTLMSRLIEKLP